MFPGDGYDPMGDISGGQIIRSINEIHAKKLRSFRPMQ